LTNRQADIAGKLIRTRNGGNAAEGNRHERGAGHAGQFPIHEVLQLPRDEAVENRQPARLRVSSRVEKAADNHMVKSAK
jgi:hypothetical protein